MSYDNNNLNNTTSSTGLTGEKQHGFNPTDAYASGGMNNSTGREPFEDSRSDFATSGAPAQAVAGNLHYGQPTSVTGGSNSGLGSSGLASTGTGLGGDHHHHSSSTEHTGTGLGGNHHNAGLEHTDSRRNAGDHPLVHDTRHHGDIRSGTADDHLVGQGRNTGAGIDGGHLAGSQTGDAPGGVQTGTGSFGTGRDVSQDDRKMTDKIKDAVTSDKSRDHHHETVGHGAHTGTGVTGGHPGAGVTGANTGASDSTVYGSNTAARDYDQRTESAGNMGVAHHQGSDSHGPVSGGAAGTDRFDAPRRDHDDVTRTDKITGTGAEHGHSVGDKGADDHKLSGLTRHGDDFTKGDTADSAYKNYDATGLSGRETTTTGVHDNNLEGTGAHKEGLMDKVKHVFGGHTNTTHADHK